MIMQGHVLDILSTLPEDSVDCVVTSPPYWGLRDYKIEPQVWDAQAGCEHEWGEESVVKAEGLAGSGVGKIHIGEKYNPRDDGLILKYSASQGSFCLRCGAWRGSLGLEPTPELFVKHIVQVFREVRRILKPTGCCLINLGDSFSSLTSSLKEWIIREDLTEEEMIYVGMEIRNKLPGLWEAYWKKKSERAVRSMLSEEIQSGTFREKTSIFQEILHYSQRAVSFKDKDSQETTKSGYDKGTRGEVCLLRGNGIDVSVPGSYQGEWTERLREERRSSRSLETSNSGGTTEGQVQDSLLELQCGIRFVRFLSSLKFKVSDIPTTIKKFFKPKNSMKAKDLVGIPWSVAFALRDDGWYLRSDIIWAKPNPMPESVTDRPTKSHEYIFLLTKSAKYFWNQEAVREIAVCEGDMRHLRTDNSKVTGGPRDDGGSRARTGNPTNGRNIRSVWTFATEPTPEAHFATFPQELVKRCILAGTSEKGCCPKCGKPWEPVVDVKYTKKTPNASDVRKDQMGKDSTFVYKERCEKITRQTGWRPTCSCGEEKTVPAVVLDPFLGSGTTGIVAENLYRKWIGIELNPEYIKIADKRLKTKANIDQVNWLKVQDVQEA